jgi:hypothetical protein
VLFANSTRQMGNGLRRHGEALGRRVVGVFQVRSIMCCELEGGLLVGGQVAVEHSNVEIVLGRIDELPAMFASEHRRPSNVQLVLSGRKFRGFVVCPSTGDVSLEFGRFRIQFVRNDAMAVLNIGTDTMEARDLPEDGLLSIADQVAHFKVLTQRSIFSSSSAIQSSKSVLVTVASISMTPSKNRNKASVSFDRSHFTF